MQGFFADAKGVSRILGGLLLAGAAGWGCAQSVIGSGPTLPEVDNSAAQAPAAPAVTMNPERFAALEARAPLGERYPAGTIKSGEVAQKALDEAKEDREAVNVRYTLDQRACYRKFLVNACLEDARDRKRLADKGIQQVENEANTYQRQATVDERDRTLAEQHAKDEQDAARRLQEQKEKEAASARKVQESNAKNRDVQQRIDQNKDVPPDYRIREHEAKVRQQQAEDAAKAPERAANAAAREQRIKDAEAHRLDVERKKAENERERAERKQRQEQSTTTAPAAK